MTAMNPQAAARFRKLCGMLGSSHDGERAAAALKATELLRQIGAGWGDVSVGPAQQPFTVWSDEDLAARSSGVLADTVKSLRAQLAEANRLHSIVSRQVAMTREALETERRNNAELGEKLIDAERQLQVAAAAPKVTPLWSRIVSGLIDVATFAFIVWIAGIVWAATTGC